MKRDVAAARAADRQGYARNALAHASRRVSNAEYAFSNGNYLAANRRLAEARIDIQLANVRREEAIAQAKRKKLLANPSQIQNQDPGEPDRQTVK